MKRKFLLVLLACWFATAGSACAQTLDQEMSRLAEKVSKSLVTLGFKSVAAIDFTDLQGQPTELGRFLSEEFSVEIVSTGGVSMVDRANIKSILAEHQLTEAGLVNPENAKKLGEFAGVDVILTGNATALDDGVVLMVKAVATSSSRVVAAGRIKFPKTPEIQQMLNRGISESSPAAISAVAVSANNRVTSYPNANGIAAKEIGPLRVVLKSVSPVKLDGWRPAIRCSFEFINTETKSPIVVAMNAVALPTGWVGRIGESLRSTLIDEDGGEWRVQNPDVAGISIVGVGQQGYSKPSYDPSEIAAVLSKRDELNSDVDNEKGSEYHFIFGSTTEIPAGQSLEVTLNFAKTGNQTASGESRKVFQLASEIVVGVAKTGTKNSYSLRNLTFDQVSLPVRR